MHSRRARTHFLLVVVAVVAAGVLASCFRATASSSSGCVAAADTPTSRACGMIVQGSDNATTTMERIVVNPEKTGFVLMPSGRPFHPWGLNYGNKGRLIEDYWETEPRTIADDFREMRKHGANVTRVHIQFGKVMTGPTTPNMEALRGLRELVHLAERTGNYLDLTGLACYRTADVPAWYDALDEAGRWAAQAVFWEAVAAACEGSPALFCFDLMNEPISPGGPRDPGAWYSGQPFGGYDFIQFITLDPAGRPRDQVAKLWIETLTAAIRKRDSQTMITVGLLPWTPDLGHLSGYIPETVAPAVDFMSVHYYPETGKVDEALTGLRKFAVGKPLVIEETFPLTCGREDLEAFLRASRDVVSGWMGHYDGITLDEYHALRDAGTITLPQSVWMLWLEMFIDLKAEISGE